MTDNTYSEAFPPEERSQAEVPPHVIRPDDCVGKETLADDKNRSDIFVVTEEGKLWCIRRTVDQGGSLDG
jgi:hypothetical protein